MSFDGHVGVEVSYIFLVGDDRVALCDHAVLRVGEIGQRPTHSWVRLVGVSGSAEEGAREMP